MSPFHSCQNFTKNLQKNEYSRCGVRKLPDFAYFSLIVGAIEVHKSNIILSNSGCTTIWIEAKNEDDVDKE